MIAPNEIESRCVGLTVAEATQRLAEVGYKLLVGEEDGTKLPTIMNHRMDRVKVAVTGGVVTGWRIG